MGTRSAPNFANVFMGYFENRFVYHSRWFKRFIKSWWRYIDDILMLWKGPRKPTKASTAEYSASRKFNQIFGWYADFAVSGLRQITSTLQPFNLCVGTPAHPKQITAAHG